ncbi:MAG: rRNA ((1618)-N(6))-methyltransferase RlmF [Sphingobacteriales bacterium]|nr:rRNA ((1618)-N(6))-methyltransferase RlmF [Sphingobacteriales bacterium]
MSIKSKGILEEKVKLHPRNKHRFNYDFPKLIDSCSELKEFVFLNDFQNQTIDFKDPKAVKILNKALLNVYYGISLWDIPEGYLCPPIPGRADYLHNLADLLAADHQNVIPKGKHIRVLDVGVGANCIYPIIGFKEYGWSFVGSDIDDLAIRSAKNIVNANVLSKAIDIRKQGSQAHVFTGIITPKEQFDLTLCNPPFHSSLSEALAGTQRKWKNLGSKNQVDSTLNFGGQKAELWCEGGEELFLKNMIDESLLFSKNCYWFSTLISKKTTLPNAYKQLKRVGATDVKTLNMAQGQKISRSLVWTFLDKAEQENWRKMRWNL